MVFGNSHVALQCRITVPMGGQSMGGRDTTVCGLLRPSPACYNLIPSNPKFDLCMYIEIDNIIILYNQTKGELRWQHRNAQAIVAIYNSFHLCIVKTGKT